MSATPRSNLASIKTALVFQDGVLTSAVEEPDSTFKGLAWVKVKEGVEWQSPIAKFFTDEERAAISTALDAEEGDVLFFVADRPAIVCQAGFAHGI